jgi:hypothetical protein
MQLLIVKVCGFKGLTKTDSIRKKSWVWFVIQRLGSYRFWVLSRTADDFLLQLPFYLQRWLFCRLSVQCTVKILSFCSVFCSWFRQQFWVWESSTFKSLEKHCAVCLGDARVAAATRVTAWQQQRVTHFWASQIRTQSVRFSPLRDTIGGGVVEGRAVSLWWGTCTIRK